MRTSCVINDTSDFYVIVWLKDFDFGPPFISIFDKSGKIISEVPLYNENDAGNALEHSKTEYFAIDKKFNILLTDTVTERKPDSNSFIITRYYISKISGNINKNGIVKYSKPLNFDLDLKDAEKDK